MIKKLKIENFKCWKNTGEIELAPLTVFFGGNSSGKSSIGQFLMMLKQSAASADRKSVFFSGDDKSAVNVGLPRQYVFNGKVEEGIKFSYSWDVNTRVTNALTEEESIYKSITFKSEVKASPGEQNLEVNRIQYSITDDHDVTYEFGIERKETSSKGRNYVFTDNKKYGLVRSRGRAWALPAPIKFYGFPDECNAYYQNSDILQELNLQQDKLFDSVFYLGPLRRKAARWYAWDGSRPASVGYDGAQAINAYLAASEDEKKLYNFASKTYKREFTWVIAEMLKKMGLVYDFKTNLVAENRQEYEVKVQVNKESELVDILDVGTGISQVLPVVIQLFYAPANSTIIMEQPELHLHPSAQAGLADVMIDAIHARCNANPLNTQLIIESHSEHFLRRIQRRIAEGKLDDSECRCYFVNHNGQSSSLELLDIDLFGNIANWPQNFFGDLDGDIIAQAKAGFAKSR